MKARKRYLTEPQAWREIARAFGERERHRGAHAGLAWSGLCCAINTLRERGRIKEALTARLRARLYDTFNPEGVLAGYWWPSSWTDIDVGREERIAACLLLALLAEDRQRTV